MKETSRNIKKSRSFTRRSCSTSCRGSSLLFLSHPSLSPFSSLSPLSSFSSHANHKCISPSASALLAKSQIVPPRDDACDCNNLYKCLRLLTWHLSPLPPGHNTPHTLLHSRLRQFNKSYATATRTTTTTTTMLCDDTVCWAWVKGSSAMGGETGERGGGGGERETRRERQVELLHFCGRLKNFCSSLQLKMKRFTFSLPLPTGTSGMLHQLGISISSEGVMIW